VDLSADLLTELQTNSGSEFHPPLLLQTGCNYCYLIQCFVYIAEPASVYFDGVIRQINTSRCIRMLSVTDVVTGFIKPSVVLGSVEWHSDLDAVRICPHMLQQSYLIGYG